MNTLIIKTKSLFSPSNLIITISFIGMILFFTMAMTTHITKTEFIGATIMILLCIISNELHLLNKKFK